MELFRCQGRETLLKVKSHLVSKNADRAGSRAVLLPHPFLKDMVEEIEPEVQQRILEETALKRWGTPTDVASAALFLASSDADFVTGELLIVAGGRVVDEWGPTSTRFNIHSIRKSLLSALYGIHVADGEIVIALAAIVSISGRAIVAVERPGSGELAVAPVPGDENGPRVVAAAHDQAGARAVEIGDAGEETVDAVAVAIAPIGDVAAGREVIGGDQGGAGFAIENR